MRSEIAEYGSLSASRSDLVLTALLLPPAISVISCCHVTSLILVLICKKIPGVQDPKHTDNRSILKKITEVPGIDYH